MPLTESIVKDTALTWFGKLGYAVGHGPHRALGELASARGTLGGIVLAERLRRPMVRLNAAIPEPHTHSHVDVETLFRQDSSRNQTFLRYGRDRI
jgi:hypothetical protein